MFNTTELHNHLLTGRLSEKALLYFNVFLSVCIIFGLTIKYALSQNQLLNSDNVIAGIMSREIWIHHNFLTNFYVSSADPNYFTFFPFHFIPQIITEFSPTTLKAVTFIVFCCAIFVFSILIFKLTKNLTCSLIFAALVSNVTPATYAVYNNPYGHVATIFFIGILLILLYDFPKVSTRNYVISLIIMALITFSDSLFVVWAVIPGLAYYFFIYSTKKFPGFRFVLLSLIAVGSVLFVKMNYLSVLQAATGDILLNDWYSMQNRFGYFIQGLILCYNDSFLNLNFKSLTMDTLFSAVLALLLVICSVVMIYLKFSDDKPDYNTHLFKFLICGYLVVFSMFFIFVFITISDPVSIPRYIIFFGFFIFLIIALSYGGEKIFSIIIIGCLILTGFSNYMYFTTTPNNPNQLDYQLIEFLESRNLTMGFAGYWDSNILTYLSNESVEIRAVFIHRGELTPYLWWSDARWYNVSTVHKYFIITNDVDNPFSHLTNNDMVQYLSVNTPTQILHYKTYNIYVFEATPPISPQVNQF